MTEKSPAACAPVQDAETCSAIMFSRPREVVIEQHARSPPGPGQFRVQTNSTLISTGTELTVLEDPADLGAAWAQFEFPFAPGYCHIGKVIEVGEGVDNAWIGRRVASYSPHTQEVLVSAQDARPVPEGISDEDATFFTIAEITMNGVRRGRVTWGESVVVYGLGVIGQLVVRMCRVAGAGPVFAVDPAANRRARLPDDEGVVAVDPEASDVAACVRQRGRGRMADVVFETTGLPALIPHEFEALRKMGRMVLLSSPRGETSFDFHTLCNAQSYEIIGAHNASHPRHETLQTPWSQHRHAELFFDLLSARAVDVASLITHRRPWREAPQLYEMLRQDRSQALGVVLEWR